MYGDSVCVFLGTHLIPSWSFARTIESAARRLKNERDYGLRAHR